MPQIPNSDIIVPPPWKLHGTAICLLASPLTVRMLVHYEDSPVGPYNEHALATLTRHGPHVFQMGVTHEASMVAGRANWGFPKRLEELEWQHRERNIEFRRHKHVFRFQAFGPRINVRLSFWTAQNRDGLWLRVPGSIKTKVRLCWHRRQLALQLENFELEIDKPQ